MRKKNILLRLLNFRVLSRYLRECAGIVGQGAGFKDRCILTFYYAGIPLTIIRSLITGKHFREIEEAHKHLIGHVTLKNRNGSFFCSNNMMIVYIADENLEKQLYPWFALNGGCFIDIGAHIGKYTIKVGANPANTVIAIEPDPFNFSLLKKNIVLNKLENIIPVNKGVFSSDAKLPFYLSGEGAGQHSFFKNSDSISSTTVGAETLDTIVSKLKLNVPVRLIKIDTEGAEAEIIKGAVNLIRHDQPDFIIEVLSENHSHLQEIKTLLQPYGYQAVQMDEDNYFFSIRSKN